MIVEKTFFAKFLQFGIALVEEKYGTSNDEKCDDPKQSENERDEDDEEQNSREKGILSSAKGI